MAVFVWRLCLVVVHASGVGPAPDVEVSLAENLLLDLGFGRSSCTRVAKLARAALQPATTSLKEVAKLTRGSHAERDLQRWCNKQAWRRLLPQPYEFHLTMELSKEESPIRLQHYSLLRKLGSTYPSASSCARILFLSSFPVDVNGNSGQSSTYPAP